MRGKGRRRRGKRSHCPPRSRITDSSGSGTTHCDTFALPVVVPTWCQRGKVKERHHKKRENQDENTIPQIVFDYGFWRGMDEEEAPSGASGQRENDMFAHVGMMWEHGAEENEKDIEKLECAEMVLKSDGSASRRK